VTAAFTVILPHKRNPGNDRALAICLDCLMRNTVSDFKLTMDAAVDQPLYARINRMVQQADTQFCVYLASDTFLAPGWDAPMIAAADRETFVNGVLVEPGAIAPHHLNFQRDFGRTPDSFQREAFEAWTQTDDAPLLEGQGWYCPYLFPREGWLRAGGLVDGQAPDHHGFTDGDVHLFERWKRGGGRVVRVRSFAYHLQRYSEPDEQNHAKRKVAYL
jgi:hypothetical protein